MCTAHAAAIDDPKVFSTYTVALLREWKAAQTEDHRQRREGWPLTTAMASEALTASFSNVAVAINNSVVHVGGEGGRALGAGGGGGGAIGPGARGGRGGEGGRIADLDGNPVSEDAIAQFLVGVDADPPPGSGGAGAGAFGPSAIGGDGGGGGDILTGTLSLEAGDVVEVEVGAGGRSAHLPGQHSAPGGDTTITVKSADGTIKRVLRTRGGVSAKSGELPEDWVTISEADLRNGLQISTLLVADAVQIRDGLLFILAGGWSEFYLPSLPFDAIWRVVCRATWTQLAPDYTRGVQLCLSAPGGREVSRLPLALPATASAGNSYTWVANLGGSLDREGPWRVSVQSGEFVLSEIEINVVVVR